MSSCTLYFSNVQKLHFAFALLSLNRITFLNFDTIIAMKKIHRFFYIIVFGNVVLFYWEMVICKKLKCRKWNVPNFCFCKTLLYSWIFLGIFSAPSISRTNSCLLAVARFWRFPFLFLWRRTSFWNCKLEILTGVFQIFWRMSFRRNASICCWDAISVLILVFEPVVFLCDAHLPENSFRIFRFFLWSFDDPLLVLSLFFRFAFTHHF